jgi:hypothetical protein
MKKLSLNPDALAVDSFSTDEVQDGFGPLFTGPASVTDADMPETPYC